jgi:hypothetical protein
LWQPGGRWTRLIGRARGGFKRCSVGRAHLQPTVPLACIFLLGVAVGHLTLPAVNAQFRSFTWIIEGFYTIDGQPTKQVKSGDLLHEKPMQIHTTENQSPVKLLVVRIVEKGKAATVRLP